MPQCGNCRRNIKSNNFYLFKGFHYGSSCIRKVLGLPANAPELDVIIKKTTIELSIPK